MNISRRNALGKMGALAGSAAALGLSGSLATSRRRPAPAGLKGRINHSVCRWPYSGISLDRLCRASLEIGIKSVEITGPDEWPVLQRYGLGCAMPRAGDTGISNGFTDPGLHDQLEESFKRAIPMVADAGYDIVICFSGDRNGLDDETGLRNCEEGLKRIMSTAERHNVTMCLEPLNSKRDHRGYFVDNTPLGVELCNRIGSDRFKLLYDIYHMQIMEGDVIRTIRDNHDYFAHYHTGGVPGRNELDETQELNWPAIMEAIVDTGYRGYVGQEFVPSWEDPLESLKHGVHVCDV